MLAITPGEPAGIGPDLVITLAQQTHPDAWVVLADPDMLMARAKALGLPLDVCTAATGKPGSLMVRPVPLPAPVTPGQLEPANVPGVLAALAAGIDGCLSGEFAALVTGPIQKSVINDAGIEFTGHTEYLRDRAGVDDVLMLLVGGSMKVALATTHLPLRDVPAAITEAGLTSALQLLIDGLATRFNVAKPRVLVTGLNPHAGESGHLGSEEVEIIGPVCDRFRQSGHAVVGPLPADTAFAAHQLEGVDAVLTMYHDQGLPVLKHASFGDAVNVTLGLPFVRTSVDHGTALDIAGSGQAHAGSLKAALALADQLT